MAENIYSVYQWLWSLVLPAWLTYVRVVVIVSCTGVVHDDKSISGCDR